MTYEQRNQLKILSAYTGKDLTEEQMEFASDFTEDRISFSNPGTGKTHTVITGLLQAQKNLGVPGVQINCMSFTNASVDEIAGRYNQACKKSGIAPTVKFNTFHSLSRQMMAEAYSGIEIVGREPIADAVVSMSDYMEKLGIDAMDKTWVKKVIRAINSLNSSLTFHPDNIRTKYDFVQTGLSVEDFQALRKKWFLRGITRKRIVQGDIPLYCLYALMKREDIIQKWRGKYRIMVVDEFQDLSLLHLHILSRIAQTLIVIGDMKQQIYAFNGACPQIVQAYLELHPRARECNLTQSFRCGQAIADFATRLIAPNNPEVETFIGHDLPSSVTIESRRNLDWADIIKGIAADIAKHRIGFARDVMFLYRNNASAIPIIDELYKLDIPFRCPKFSMIMDIPIFDSLCKLANAAWQPHDEKFVNDALREFPEFKEYMFGDELPIITVMKQTGKSLFDIQYRYKEKSSYEILNAMMVARKKIEEGKSAGIVLNNLLPVYETYIIRGQWWRLDNDKEFYFNLVAPICNAKPYPLMYNEELDKCATNEKCIKGRVGIRCYTMHSAKGLEADDVYILDCDDGMFPNAKVLKSKLEAGCYVDAATDVRSERNLLYVAVTRARYNVTISHSSDTPTPLLVNPGDNDYCNLDHYYWEANRSYDDAGEFFKLFNAGGGSAK